MGVELVRGRDARSALPAPLTIAAGRNHTAETILRAWFEGKSDHTVRSYRHDLEDFALFFSRALRISPRMTVNESLSRLFKQSSPSAHEIVLGFRQHLAAAHLSSASINRHLACLRSVSKLGRMLGMMTCYLEMPGVKAERRRQTAGPTIPDVQAMLNATMADTEAETRDYAIVLTFFALGLRVSELCGLNSETTDLSRGNTWIKGKGRKEKELVPLPDPVVTALRRYIQHRDSQAGPLFQTVDDAARPVTDGWKRVPRRASSGSSGSASACTSGVTDCATAASPRPSRWPARRGSGWTRSRRTAGMPRSGRS